MKKHLLAFLSVGLTVAALHSSLAQDNVTRVACVGDSITQGVGADPGQSYPEQLGRLLGDKWVVTNFGLSGRTMLKKGDYPYWNEPALQSALDSKPQVVIILLGTNDTKPQNWAHKDEFASDYKEMIERFQSLPTKPRIFLGLPTPIAAGGNYGISEDQIAEEIPQIKQLAKDMHCELIDMHGALIDSPKDTPDSVHPNTVGAGKMAKTAAAALTSAPAAQ